MLDVAGKVFARVLQDRLRAVVTDVLPDSQCGFRKGRGCIDMVFCARQLLEKSIEHDCSLYVLFVDLKKAYDHPVNCTMGSSEEARCTANYAQCYTVLP